LTGEIRWKSLVWACPPCLEINNGVVKPDQHKVEVLQQNKRVVLFGVSDQGVYVELFRAYDGRCLFWFCSCFSDRSAWQYVG
jgi:hypothetical protein